MRWFGMKKQGLRTKNGTHLTPVKPDTCLLLSWVLSLFLDPSPFYRDTSFWFLSGKGGANPTPWPHLRLLLLLYNQPFNPASNHSQFHLHPFHHTRTHVTHFHIYFSDTINLLFSFSSCCEGGRRRTVFGFLAFHFWFELRILPEQTPWALRFCTLRTVWSNGSGLIRRPFPAGEVPATTVIITTLTTTTPRPPGLLGGRLPDPTRGNGPRRDRAPMIQGSRGVAWRRSRFSAGVSRWIRRCRWPWRATCTLDRFVRCLRRRARFLFHLFRRRSSPRWRLTTPPHEI